MFNIPMHASKNAVERNRSLFFLSFSSKTRRRNRVEANPTPLSRGCGFNGRPLPVEVPLHCSLAGKGICLPKMGIHHNYIFGLCKLWEFIIIFLWLCRFIVVVFLYFFPLYFPPYLPWQFPSLRLYVLSPFSPFFISPPLNEMSQWRFLGLGRVV